MTDFAKMSTRDRDWRAYVDLGGGEVARKVALTGGGGGTDPVSGEPNGSYDAAEFQVSTATTNYDVESNQSALWNNISSPSYINFRTDQTVTIRLNDTSYPAITVTSTDSPFIIENGLPIDNIYITNSSGSTANIKIFMF
jgi:hypothetical protein